MIHMQHKITNIYWTKLSISISLDKVLSKPLLELISNPEQILMCWPQFSETNSVCCFHPHYRMTILYVSCTSNLKIPVNLHAQVVMNIQNIKAIGHHNLASKQVRFHYFKSKSMLQKFHLQNGDNSNITGQPRITDTNQFKLWVTQMT